MSNLRSSSYHPKGAKDIMTIEIPLTKGKTALIDDEDYHLVNQFKWYAIVRRSAKSERWYVETSNQGKHILMHRFILEIPSGLQCDHINGNGLDNRRCNLRIVTNTQNQMNTNKRKNKCSSRFKGVVWDKERRKWIAYITLNQKSHYLGRFSSEIEAAKVYDKAAKKHFREYAKLNFQ